MPSWSAPSQEALPPLDSSRQGRFDVITLEKSRFPREKVCIDGLTRRAARETKLVGLPTPHKEHWIPGRGLRRVGGGR